MNRKRTVIFHLNNKEQFFGEFHENTKIKMVKSYFKDISHYTKFRVVFKGRQCNNDELSLRDLTKSRNGTDILLHVFEYDKNEFLSSSQAFKGNLVLSDPLIETTTGNKYQPEGKMNTDYELFKLHSSPDLHSEMKNQQSYTLDDILRENNTLKAEKADLTARLVNQIDENAYLNSTVLELNNKLNVIQRAYEIASHQALASGKMVEQLKSEITQLESLYKANKEKLERYLKDKDMLRKSEDPKRKSAMAAIRVPKHSPLPEKKLIARKGHYDEMYGDRKNKSEAKLTWDQNDGEKVNMSLNECFSYDMLQKKNSGHVKMRYILSDSQSPWVTIIPFLPREDQINLSLASKEDFKRVVAYCYDLACYKSSNIQLTLNCKINKYEGILKDTPFQLSRSTLSALKILNTAKYSDVFLQDDISSFNDPSLLVIYRVLFQITKTIDDNLSIENKDFIQSFVDIFKAHLKTSKGIGDYLQSSVKHCDFSQINLDKVRSIMETSQLKSIDCSKIGKICKTTGTISFFVKDALTYCGIETESLNTKKGKDDKQTEKATLFRDNSDLKERNRTTEALMRRLYAMFIKF